MRRGPGPSCCPALLGIATVLVGALRACCASVRLSPAVAMSPPAPPPFRRGWVDGLGQGLHLRQTTMMILRSITRWPGRALVTLFGVRGLGRGADRRRSSSSTRWRRWSTRCSSRPTASMSTLMLNAAQPTVGRAMPRGPARCDGRPKAASACRCGCATARNRNLCRWRPAPRDARLMRLLDDRGQAIDPAATGSDVARQPCRHAGSGAGRSDRWSNFWFLRARPGACRWPPSIRQSLGQTRLDGGTRAVRADAATRRR